MVRSLNAFCCLVLLLSATRVSAEFTRFATVASGLYRPVFAATPPGQPDRMFIAQKDGVIRILDLETRTLLPEPFLEVQNVREQSEGGMLGFAFHPDYANNGKFYTYATLFNDNPASFFSSHVQEYTVSPNDRNVALAAPNDILVFEQPAPVHNAGWLGFNPQLAPGDAQYLHIASGDGGARSNAQDLTDNLFGSILRIDVDGDDFPADDSRDYAIPASNPFVGTANQDEVWSYGLRNPWRVSFDRENGDLWIGDVGSGDWEEINHQPANSGGGEN